MSQSEKSAFVNEFVQGKMEGKSSSQVARDAGYAESTARRANAQIANKPAVRKLFAELMEQAGLDDAHAYDEVVIPFLDRMIMQFPVIGYPADPPVPPLSDAEAGRIEF